MTSEIVKSVSIENMVNQRAAVVEKMSQALDLLAEAQALASAAHIGFPRMVMDNGYRCRGNLTVCGSYASPKPDVLAEIVREVDSTAWAYLMRESGMRTFMDAKAREEWDAQIHKGEVPALTFDTVKATFSHLHGARGDMFERGVIHCFRRLSWNYKTNSPVKFGKRIIISNVFTYGSPNCRACSELDDLVRVFSVLDGKPEPDHRNGMHSKIYDSRRAGSREIEGDYFSIKWFKNGNGHLMFKRLDLVERMNQILAKHHPNALPAKQ